MPKRPYLDYHTKERVHILRVLTYAGAIMAFLIGSGFATGQEILQYYAGFGLWGILGTGSIVMILMTFVAVELFTTGQREKLARPSLVFRYYGGRWIGGFYDFFSILFVFLSFTVMVAGAGAVFKEHYGLSQYLGGSLLAIAVGITVWFGLSSLVDVIGKIGPLIVVIAVGLGVVGIVVAKTGIVRGSELTPTLDLNLAASTWYFSALSYVGFCMLWLAAFLTALGKSASSRREAASGGALGAVVFALACMVVGLGLLANIEAVAGTEIPMLILANELAPWIGAGISVMILAGIYTTAVPLLWTVSSRFYKDSTKQFKYLTIALAVLGTLVGLVLPFSKMVSLVYGINGFVGAVFIGLMVITVIRRLTTGKSGWIPEGERTSTGSIAINRDAIDMDEELQEANEEETSSR